MDKIYKFAYAKEFMKTKEGHFKKMSYSEFKEKHKYDEPRHSFYYHYIKRPVSYPLSWLVYHTPLTPNQLNLFGFLSAVLSTFFFGIGSYLGIILGMVLFQFMEIFDDLDGIIARAKNIKSRRGGWFDILAGCNGKLLVIAGISIGIFRVSNSPSALLWGIAAILGLSALYNIDHVSIIRFSKVEQRKRTYSETKEDSKTLTGKLKILMEVVANSWYLAIILSAIFNEMFLFLKASAAYYISYSILWFVYLAYKHRNN